MQAGKAFKLVESSRVELPLPPANLFWSEDPFNLTKIHPEKGMRANNKM